MGTGERAGTLEIAGASDALLDEPFALRVRGGRAATWRARLRDDDGRVWKAAAPRPDELAAAWVAAKETTGELAGLGSLRPVRIDVRVEAADGRSAERKVTRRFVADGVKVRRWREGDLQATLYLPAGESVATALVDDASATSRMAAPLLASRGVLMLVVSAGPVETARQLLSAVPGAAGEVQTPELLLPPGVPARMSRADAAARGPSWDALLAELGAAPREGA